MGALPFEVTVTPDPEVIGLGAGAVCPPFRDLSKACLSEAVISSVFLEWLSPAVFIRSIRAASDIFRVLAKSLTVKVKIYILF